MNKISSLNSKIKATFSDQYKKRLFFGRVLNVFASVIRYAFLIGIAFIIVYPLLVQLALAFRLPTDVNDPEVMWIPKTFSLQNFKIAFVALDYWKSLGTTLMNSLIISLCQVISTATIGYVIARLHIKGQKVLFFLVLFTIIVPQTMVSLPMYTTYAKMHLLGNKFVLYLMAFLGMGIKSGIFIYLFRQSFKALPTELEEAAYMDGCNPFGVYVRIMFPNVSSTIIVVLILSFVWQWNDYYFTNLFFVGSSDATSLATQLQIIGTSGPQQALREAGIWQLLDQDAANNPLFVSMITNTSGILSMLPVLIFYFFVQKLFVEGTEKSGIVG